MRAERDIGEPGWVRAALILAALAVIGVMLVLPVFLAIVFLLGRLLH